MIKTKSNKKFQGLKRGQIILRLEQKFQKLKNKTKKSSSKLKLLEQKMSRVSVIEKLFKKYRRFTRKMIFAKDKLLEQKPSFHTHKMKPELERRLINLNKSEISIYGPRNIIRNSLFKKFLRKALRKKLRMRLSETLLTKISTKNPFDFKFLKRSRKRLIQTKKYLYRKSFPKIKGVKNLNFNFAFYSSIEKSSVRFFYGRLVITYLPNNTFMNLHNSKKMLKVISAGKIGLKGPKRSTPYSRQVVARKMTAFLLKSKLNVLDIYLNSNYNRWYYFLFKEFSKPINKEYVIRYLVSNNSRSHGFIRDKKHRRK